MKILRKTSETVHQTSYGAFGLTMFLICAVSGLFLVVPYDVSHPYTSVSLFILTRPWADFIRNLHYWSAQAFLILTLFHSWDHLKKNMLRRITRDVWLRLCLSLLFVFYVMISGYFLKGDTEGSEALNIFRGLLKSIPLAGNVLSDFLTGKGSSLVILYVHHIATTTLFIAIVIYEHAKKLWDKRSTFLLSLGITGIISLFFRAPLHDGFKFLIKGPWYFQGLQEILHWFSSPLTLILFFSSSWAMIWSIRIVIPKYAIIIRRFIIGFAGVYVIFSIVAIFFRASEWKLINPLKTELSSYLALPTTDLVFASEIPGRNLKSNLFKPVMGRYESCLACHQGMTGLSSAHDPAVIGCVSCHQGDPFAVTKNAAHRGMNLIPGNMKDASQSCGTQNCHGAITDRINSSMMAKLNGLISVDKWTFNEYPTPDSTAGIEGIRHSPADEHLRNLCLGCHLGQDKKIPGPADDISKGGGCNACHLVYDAKTTLAVSSYFASTEPGKQIPRLHPNLSVNVTDDKCFSCHNRSGRISPSYEGYFETQKDSTIFKNRKAYKIVDGYRVFEKREDDVHHKAGMSCVDCHNSYEIMGDGKSHAHEEEAVKIQCKDCHSYKPVAKSGKDGIDAESGKILLMNTFLKRNDNFIKSPISGRIYVNTQVPKNGNPWLIAKNSGKKLEMKPPKVACTSSPAHKNLSCVACHAAQAPTCLGCHNEYKPSEKGFDQVSGREITGTWVESIGTYEARPPTLGVRINCDGEREIVPFIPGMILTIDPSSRPHGNGKPVIFKRLYAPIDPHTTASKGRSCKSCHNDPATIGYGEGTLVYEINGTKGTWKFSPKYEDNAHDGLPEDAWTGFLKERTDEASSRKNHRPFTLKEQQNMLRVGACLGCHDANSKAMQDGLIDFQRTFHARRKFCSTPW